MSTSAQRRSQHHESPLDHVTTRRSPGQDRSGVVGEPGLLSMDGLVTSGRRSISGWRRVLARLAGVSLVQVIDLRPQGGLGEEDVVVDLRDASLRPSSSMSALREAADDLSLKPRRRAADARTVSQDDVGRQPSVEEGFFVSLTDKDLVRRRDEIIARTQAEIDELEARSAHG